MPAHLPTCARCEMGDGRRQSWAISSLSDARKQLSLPSRFSRCTDLKMAAKLSRGKTSIVLGERRRGFFAREDVMSVFSPKIELNEETGGQHVPCKPLVRDPSVLYLADGVPLLLILMGLPRLKQL